MERSFRSAFAWFRLWAVRFPGILARKRRGRGFVESGPRPLRGLKRAAHSTFVQSGFPNGVLKRLPGGVILE